MSVLILLGTLEVMNTKITKGFLTDAEHYSQENLPESVTQQSASDAKSVKIPLLAYDQVSRRSKLILFTCDKCGEYHRMNVPDLLVFCMGSWCKVFRLLLDILTRVTCNLSVL